VKLYSRRLQSSVSVDFAQADGIAALGVASAILLGLYARARGSGGQETMTTMLSTAAHALSDDMVEYADRGELPQTDDELYGLAALYRLYETAEGWVFLAAPESSEWLPLLAALPEGHTLGTDRRFATVADRRVNDEALAQDLAAIFRRRAATDWEAVLLAAGVGCVKVAEDTIEHRFMSDEFGRASGYLADIDHPTFGEHPRLAPLIRFSRSATQALPGQLLGASTDAVLAEIGRTSEEIAQLRARGVIGG
jgi:crotonobetainyl-CoA:carnitine CoA-transferase CaiB-like acyl-CoA transferase